ncbi:MAG: hypothetical protein H7Y04_03245 [Verrucomicrobia bacterium]|nr:hypothetical protein [Cytophagales bacterium]
MNAKDLLLKVLDYDCRYELSLTKWSYKEEANPPKFYRQKQIEALLKALKLTTEFANPKHYRTINEVDRKDYLKIINNFQYFVSGEFVIDRETSIYREISDSIIQFSRQYAKKMNLGYYPKVEVTLQSIETIFRELYQYRKSITKLVNSRYIYLEGVNIVPRYVQHIVDPVNQLMQREIV